MAVFIRGNNSIHYEIKGMPASPLMTPLLFLHGNDENMNIFSETAAPLMNSKSIVLMDSRLQGKSFEIEESDKEFSYYDMADDALALMKSLGIHSYDVVGNSDGGIIALIMAMRTYDVRRVVTVGANADPKGLTAKAVREIKAELKRTEATSDKRKSRLLNLMLKGPHITVNDLAGIVAEVTVLLGRRDNMIDKKHSEHIADAIPRGSHKYLDDAGHDAVITHAGLLSDIIKTLL